MDRGGSNRPPTAIKAVYYRYQFSRWDELQRGRWWTRTPIQGSPPQLILKPLEHTPVRRASPYRSWTLGACVIGAAAAAVAVLRGNVAMAHRCGLGLLGAGFLVAFGVMLSAEYTAKECAMVPGMDHARRLATALLEGPMASYFEGRHGYTKLHAMIAAGLAATAVTVLGAASAAARGGVPVSSFAVVVACVVCFVLATPPWPVAYIT